MIERTVTVQLTAGLQARPAAKFVQEANQFSADIYLKKDGKRVNAKSIMGLMSLAVGNGEDIVLQADGDDAEEALEKLSTFVIEE
ncbi:HPr family phosphocarrier protein [Salirhabdus salicampi]|uniref:HPr family phosphocarrier protein n=1 Tax=Salirhabdus salicampi TaxID=476102 RepID=UPI0020C2BC25|nr:HPr family phosphocarrier protein [Salirhabdus salicampi]